MSNNQDLVRLADACRFENSGNNYTVRGFVKKVNYVPASGRGASYIDITIVDSTGEFPGKLFLAVFPVFPELFNAFAQHRSSLLLPAL